MTDLQKMTMHDLADHYSRAAERLQECLKKGDEAGAREAARVKVAAMAEMDARIERYGSIEGAYAADPIRTSTGLEARRN